MWICQTEWEYLIYIYKMEARVCLILSVAGLFLFTNTVAEGFVLDRNLRSERYVHVHVHF